MKSKQCTRCKKVKDVGSFSRKEWREKIQDYVLRSACKECEKERKHQHYLANKERYIAKVNELRKQYPERKKKYDKKYRSNNKDYIREKYKEYSQTEHGKAMIREKARRQRSKPENKIKTQARKKVRTALENGTLVKPTSCASCRQNKSYLEAHHIDYHSPLDVVWLCKQCHEDTHHLNEEHES